MDCELYETTFILGLHSGTRIPKINGPNSWMDVGTTQLTTYGRYIYGEMDVPSKYHGVGEWYKELGRQPKIHAMMLSFFGWIHVPLFLY
jgi:hypothetical protein